MSMLQPEWPVRLQSVASCASPRKVAPASEHQKFVAATFASRGSRRFEPETESVASFFPGSSRDDPRKMASYIEEAERLRSTLPLDDLLAEASQLEAEVKAKRKAKEQKLAAARLGQQERSDAEKRINELARKLEESSKIYKAFEQDEVCKLSEFEGMVLRRQGARARIDNLHVQFEQKTSQRRNLQKQVKEIEQEQCSSRDSLVEPSPDIALVALRREKQRLEDLLRRQRALDPQRTVDAEVQESSEESEDSRDGVPPDMQAMHDDKVLTLEMAKWELRAARGIAAISA